MRQISGRCLVFALGFAIYNSLSANPFDHNLWKPLAIPKKDFGSIKGNERFPYDAAPILDEVPPNTVWVIVGGERAPRTFSYRRDQAFGIFIDMNPSVVLWDRIDLNLAVLAQGDLKLYQSMRFHGTHEKAWEKVRDQMEAVDLTPKEKQYMSFDYLKFYRGHSAPRFRQASSRYETRHRLNYASYPDQFAHYSRMAAERKIDVVQIDLSKPSQVEKFTERLKKLSAPLGLVDLSNVPGWFQNNYEMDKTRQVLKILQPAAHKNAVFLSTEQHTSWGFTIDWNYRGVRLADRVKPRDDYDDWRIVTPTSCMHSGRNH